MPSFSKRSDKVYILKPVPSRARRIWWLAVHGVAVAGLAGSGLRVGIALVLVAIVIVHAWRRAPPAAPLMLVTERGAWSVPDAGLFGVELDARSASTPLWVRLVLGRGRARHTFVLLRPEFARADWRRIQLALRAAGGRA